jgi:hypothetical protein
MFNSVVCLSVLLAVASPAVAQNVRVMEGATVWSLPNEQSRLVARLSMNQEVEIIPRALEDPGWHKVKLPGVFPRIGYLRSRFVDRGVVAPVALQSDGIRGMATPAPGGVVLRPAAPTSSAMTPVLLMPVATTGRAMEPMLLYSATAAIDAMEPVHLTPAAPLSQHMVPMLLTAAPTARREREPVGLTPAVAISQPLQVASPGSVPAQPLSERTEYRILATNKTSTMQKEMQEAGDAGFQYAGAMGGETSFGGSEVVVVMVKDGTPHQFGYRLLATSKTSTMQKEMQEAGDAGFEYRGQTVFKSTFGGKEVVVILERDPTSSDTTRYEYRLLAAKKTSTLQKELVEAGEHGFSCVGLTVAETAIAGTEVVAILRRQAR